MLFIGNQHVNIVVKSRQTLMRFGGEIEDSLAQV
jgi:hypothetical protein